MVWDCNGIGEDHVNSGIGLSGASGVAFAEVLGPAAGSVVVDFTDVGVGGGVDFGDDGVGFSVEVFGPAACSVRGSTAKNLYCNLHVYYFYIPPRK